MRFSAVLASLALGPLAGPALADSTSPLHRDEGAPGGGDVQWLYWSPLCVEETITDVGGGMFEYSYRFTNVDTNHIWHFIVYMRLADLENSSTWATHPMWGQETRDLGNTHENYDARNLDPTLVMTASTWSPDWPNPKDPIVPGEMVAGFTFLAPGLDPEPKYYAYETVENGWAGWNGNTDFLAAVGLTCTGPTVVSARDWGGIKALYR